MKIAFNAKEKILRIVHSSTVYFESIALQKIFRTYLASSTRTTVVSSFLGLESCQSGYKLQTQKIL